MPKDPQRARKIQDFVVTDVLEEAGYSDRRIVITLVDVQGGSLRLHLTAVTGELLCERFANALEERYGK
ncbi:hypothetical protein RFM68_15625 [Mesorhizobium sp. MSK_1335]|uniref:Uncharacterized protein n=1 Tax=Mesorhizobium montanum TaxID=3072323 RepID=A0ABU4ZKP1_9HYPH|nr:hypothetical protein [Mesorhizobium sp. MSK_1335]MDX8525935.1 hypothetical protein [Mesorhizobium sp. MSK_1335]